LSAQSKDVLQPGRLKILIAVRHPVGGIRTFLRYVHARLDPTRYEVSLVLPESAEQEAIRSDFSAHLPAFFFVPSDTSLVRLVLRLLEVARFQKPHVIHSQGLTAGVCASVAAMLTRTPHVMTLHDVFLPPMFRGFTGYLKHLMLSLFLRLPQRIHCVSQDVRENLLEFFPSQKKNGSRVVVIFNGIDVERFANVAPRGIRSQLGLMPDTFLLGFFGRFMSQKGFKYLVDAVALLVKGSTLPRSLFVLTFSNDGFYREEQARVRELGLEPYFRFLPFEPNIAPILHDLDAVAIPSLWEACPLVPMEAMVAGVPVIGTDCIGLREVLAKTPSRICPAKDSVALAEAIQSEMLNSTKSEAAIFKQEAAGRFDVRERANEIETLLRGLAGLS